MNFSTLLKVFLILQISVSVKCSCLDNYIGDGYCDDENNNDGCNYDEGKMIFDLFKKVNLQKRPANARVQFLFLF